MYFVESANKEYDENSEVNLDIKRRFIAHEVKQNLTDIVEYVLAASEKIPLPPFTYEDVEEDPPKKVCPTCGHDLDSVDEVDFVSPLDAENVPIRAVDGVHMCPICGAGFDSEEEARECCSDQMLYKCTSCGELFTPDDYDELSEVGGVDSVLEWWLVSPWMRDRLLLLGEPVIAEYCIWGRKDNGPLPNDEVITKICLDVDILEGQKNEWRPKTA